jgi:hypothetical protein
MLWFTKESNSSALDTSTAFPYPLIHPPVLNNTQQAAFCVKGEFSIVPEKFIGDLVERFLAQANGGQDLRTSDYPKEYRELQVKVGFGQGAFSRVPWIAFLGQDQKVSCGIYPVLLYYREARVLILAYGISETNPPTIQWQGLDQARSVAAYLRQEHCRKSGISRRSVLLQGSRSGYTAERLSRARAGSGAVS